MRTLGLPAADPYLVVPAQIFLVVAAYRCLLPNRYESSVVFHASPLSSTFVTRTLATFAEVAWIYQISHVIRVFDIEKIVWVEVCSWAMVVQIVVSQICVWGAILADRPRLYFWEELGWFVIFVLSSIASAYLLMNGGGLGGGRTLLQLNLWFAGIYLPWQVVNLMALRARVRSSALPKQRVTGQLLASGAKRALFEYRRATDAESWGGLLGLSWMVGYWATLVPLWLAHVAQLAR